MMASHRHRIVIPLAGGFEETEAVAPADVLSRAGIHPLLVHLPDDIPTVAGSHRIKVVAEATLAGLHAEDFSGIFLPGGMPGTRRLLASLEVRAMVREFHRGGGLIAAICAAPLILHDLGIIDGRRVTSHPSCDADLAGCAYATSPVVVDRPFITSRGPGTALLCGLTVVACLRGAPEAVDLASAMAVEVPETVRKEWDRWDLTP